MTTRQKFIVVILALLALSAFVGSALALGALAVSTIVQATGNPGLTSDSGVEPIFVAGNPDCAALNADNANFPTITSSFGFKVNGSSNGTYYFTSLNGELTGGAPPDPNNYVTISNSDGVYFDWETSLGIDAVIVKGGPNANAFVYPLEATLDSDLHAPINPSNGMPFGVSHIEFCYDYEVAVSKIASTTFTRTYTWDITKEADATYDLFTGDTQDHKFTVSVTKDGGTDSDWAVSGEITIYNPAPMAATVESVTDVVSVDIAADVDCGVTFPYSLASLGTLNCAYIVSLPDGADRMNASTVTTSGSVGGGMATAEVIFGDPTNLVNDTITVDDTNGDSWQFSGSGSVSYEKTFTCNADEGQHDNTATIRETGQSDSVSVTVNCHALKVTKEANTSYIRNWNWTIDKTADQTDLSLAVGAGFTVNYQVTVSASSSDSNHAVSGSIAVHNPSPMTATINGVSDVVSPDIAASVDCGVTFPYSLAAEGALNCTYSASLPDGNTRLNTAAARLQNYHYASDDTKTENGTTEFFGTAEAIFSTPTSESDECVDVVDDQHGSLGTVCAGEAPLAFTYSMTVGPYEVCGTYTFTNTASITTSDTRATDSDNWTVAVVVPCPTACVRTQGYWKNHSKYGPSPYDDTWEEIGEDTPFYESGQSYYQVLWTNPNGNAYYQLAHQFIAAQLNIKAGASQGPISAEMARAMEIFNAYTPAQIGELKGNDPLRKEMLEIGETLDRYNNGLLGPAKCE